jgi:hypothetical protein
MLPRDANDNAYPALHPLDGSLQVVAADSAEPETTVAVVAEAFDPNSKAVAVKVTTGNTAHVRLGGADVEATDDDLPLISGDGWVYLSLEGQAAAGGSKPNATHLSIRAAGGAVSVQVVEFN